MIDDQEPKRDDPVYFSFGEALAESNAKLNESVAAVARAQTVRRRKKAEAAIRAGQPRPASVPEDLWENVQTEAIKWSKSSGQSIDKFGLVAEADHRRFEGNADEGARGKDVPAYRRYSLPHGHPDASKSFADPPPSLDDASREATAAQNRLFEMGRDIVLTRAASEVKPKRTWRSLDTAAQVWTIIGGVAGLLALVLGLVFGLPAYIDYITPDPTPSLTP